MEQLWARIHDSNSLILPHSHIIYILYIYNDLPEKGIYESQCLQGWCTGVLLQLAIH